MLKTMREIYELMCEFISKVGRDTDIESLTELEQLGYRICFFGVIPVRKFIEMMEGNE